MQGAAAAALLLAATSAVASGQATGVTPSSTAPYLFGGYTDPMAPTNATTTLLLTALSHPENYEASVKARVCVSEVFAYETQVVAGLNYRFHVRGANVTKNQVPGKCAKKPSKPTNMTIIVWEQKWAQRLNVTSITLA